MTKNAPITRHLIPEDQRLSATADLFGTFFPLRLEPVIYGITDRMAEDYHGGYWLYYLLENGGFYMAPNWEQHFSAKSLNGWQGELSADALGIIVCLTAYSHLSFGGPEPFARTCAEQYHLLREYMCEHPELGEILGAID
ncbi:antirestriction protein [Pseudohalioglobus lutimaris]|nr:antirestriction protein [Pseudohalioglobus lutimaris]